MIPANTQTPWNVASDGIITLQGQPVAYYDLVNLTRPTGHPWVDQLAPNLWMQHASNMARATKRTAPPQEVTGLTSTLLPTQHGVVQAMLTAQVLTPHPTTPPRRTLICADEPGLGKTLAALAVLRATANPAHKACIVVPSSLTANWAAEMLTHFELGIFTPHIATGKTPTGIPPEADTLIIGWAVIEHWVNTITKWAPSHLIVDEGHYAKAGRLETEKVKRGKKLVNEKIGGAARATAVLDLAETTPNTLILTGTPAVNRPAEIWPLLEMAGIGHYFGGKEKFLQRHCAPRTFKRGKRTVRIANGATNLAELGQRLASSGHYLRRLKADIGLPPKIVDGAEYYDRTAQRRPLLVTPQGPAMDEYRAAEKKAKAQFSALLSRGEGAVRKEGMSNISVITELRQLIAQAKIPAVKAYVDALIAQGNKVVIAAHHRDIVDAYADYYTGLKIQGGMKVQAVEEAKKLFNSTPTSEHPVIVVAVEAGKTGHTLCKQPEYGHLACSHMVFGEQIYTPGDEAQMQDRIWRVGQNRDVIITNILADGTVDIHLWQKREEKRRVVDAVTDNITPQSTEVSDRSGAGDVALFLAKGH